MHTNCCQPLCGGQTQTWLNLLRVGRGRRKPAILSPSTPAVIYLLPLTGAQRGEEVGSIGCPTLTPLQEKKGKKNQTKPCHPVTKPWRPALLPATWLTLLQCVCVFWGEVCNFHLHSEIDELKIIKKTQSEKRQYCKGYRADWVAAAAFNSVAIKLCC